MREYSRRHPDDAVLERFLESARYLAGEFDDPMLDRRLAEQCGSFDNEAGVPLNRCFYLSTAPTFFPGIVEALGEHGLNLTEGAEMRVVIEKPIGASLADAQELNRRVLGHVVRVLGAGWCELDASLGSRLRLDTGTVSVLGWERETRVIHHWNGG